MWYRYLCHKLNTLLAIDVPKTEKANKPHRQMLQRLAIVQKKEIFRNTTVHNAILFIFVN